MKYAHWIAVAAIALVLFGAGQSTAETWKGWRGSRNWGVHSLYQKLYKASDVVMISGEVIDVTKQVPMKGMYFGVFLLVKTDKETLSVHLGPSWYIERLDYPILPGDTVEVKGARILFNSKPAVIAAEVRKGGKILILRDGAGIPVWAGWGWKR
jgi:hypothetical protein